MVTGVKKPRAKWTAEVERKLIDVWADSLEEMDGKMIMRKKKESIATVLPRLGLNVLNLVGAQGLLRLA